jgi:hypothetical protein
MVAKLHQQHNIQYRKQLTHIMAIQGFSWPANLVHK